MLWPAKASRLVAGNVLAQNPGAISGGKKLLVTFEIHEHIAPASHIWPFMAIYGRYTMVIYDNRWSDMGHT